jgi:hypothetical protein
VARRDQMQFATFATPNRLADAPLFSAHVALDSSSLLALSVRSISISRIRSC